MRADPWTQKTLRNGLNTRYAIEATNMLQHFCIEKTRLGIPVLLAEECPHGRQLREPNQGRKRRLGSATTVVGQSFALWSLNRSYRHVAVAAHDAS